MERSVEDVARVWAAAGHTLSSLPSTRTYTGDEKRAVNAPSATLITSKLWIRNRLHLIPSMANQLGLNWPRWRRSAFRLGLSLALALAQHAPQQLKKRLRLHFIDTSYAPVN